MSDNLAHGPVADPAHDPSEAESRKKFSKKY
jgi:hypothetical protein